MRNAIKHIVGSTWQPLLVRYLSKPRTYRYKDIQLEIPTSVFHPGFFFSTQLLLKQLTNMPLKGKRVLEPGAGSGLLSIYAAKQGAEVTATDISPVAVACIRRNGALNEVPIRIIESDLFDDIPRQTFDIVVINPPYYKKEPASYADFAWNCGENGEYFKKLFGQLAQYVHPHTTTLMVLCDGCDLEMIRSMADANGFCLRVILTRQNVLERNFIYSIESSQ